MLTTFREAAWPPAHPWENEAEREPCVICRGDCGPSRCDADPFTHDLSDALVAEIEANVLISCGSCALSRRILTALAPKVWTSVSRTTKLNMRSVNHRSPAREAA